MEKIRVRCRSCGKELEGQPGRAQCCGCSNMTTIKGDSVTARDLSLVVMLNAPTERSKKGVLSDQDILWQEERRKRKVRKLDFEIR
jgi:ribosomal protein S27E